MERTSNTPLYIAIFIALVSIVTAIYLAYQNHTQNSRIETLLQERNVFLQQSNQKDASLTVASTTISELKNELHEFQTELEELADDYRDEKNRNEEFEDQLRDLAGDLGDLDKLAKTDKELLAKYSKVYFLNENYIPERLKQIDEKYILPGKKDQYFLSGTIKHLTSMLDDAKNDGVDLIITSAFRSFDEQVDLKGQYTQLYGTGANAFSADQGYSEHQLGTTVDLTTPEVGGAYASFAQTPAYQWLLENAHRYGFILSYPEGNEFYVYEPWHWRYVGVDFARDLHRDGKNFYTLDQREIDQYLLNFYE